MSRDDGVGGGNAGGWSTGVESTGVESTGVGNIGDDGTAHEPRKVRFGAFELELDVPELRRHGVPVAIRATPLRVLVALGRRIGQVVSRQQILDEVWADSTVTEASLSTALRELRAALGDDGRSQRFIQTLRHRGVRLSRPTATARPADRDPSVGGDPAIGEGPPAGAGAEGDGAANDVETDAERHYALLSRLGSVLFEGGRLEEGRAAYREAARAARGEGDHAKFVLAALEFTGELANMETAIYSEERVALLREAIAFEEAVPASLRARLRARLALNLAWTRRDEALRLAGDAIQRARAAGDSGALARVLHDAYWVVWSPDNLDERHALAREMIGAATASGDPFLAGFAYVLESAALLEGGDRASADAAVERAWEGFRTRERTEMPVWRSGWQASMAHLDGRFREAERYADRAARESQALHIRNTDRIHALQLGWLRFDQGRLAELGPLADRVDASLPITRAGRAFLRHAAGRVDEARRDFETLTDEVAVLPRDPFWMGTLTILAELALWLEDAVRANALFEALRPHEAQCVLFGVRSTCRGSVALYLGLLARLAGRREAVVPQLEAAVRANARLRALPLLARSQLELARALCDRAQGDDLARALALRSDSNDLHHGLGLHHRERAIAELGERLRSRTAPR